MGKHKKQIWISIKHKMKTIPTDKGDYALFNGQVRPVLWFEAEGGRGAVPGGAIMIQYGIY